MTEPTVETTDFDIETRDDVYLGSFVTKVSADPGDAEGLIDTLTAARDRVQRAEGVEDAELVAESAETDGGAKARQPAEDDSAPESDETTTPDDNNGPYYRTFYTDDGYLRLDMLDQQSRELRPTNRMYVILWSIAYYEQKTGNAVTPDTVRERGPFSTTIGSAFTRLRRMGCISKVEGDKYRNVGYRVTPEGVWNLRRLGEPAHDHPGSVDLSDIN